MLLKSLNCCDDLPPLYFHHPFNLISMCYALIDKENLSSLALPNQMLQCKANPTLNPNI